MLHPVHIHGCQFRIISRDGKPPEPVRAGWKMSPRLGRRRHRNPPALPVSRGPDNPYMTHCHILEHEDSGMMAQFTVS